MQAMWNMWGACTPMKNIDQEGEEKSLETFTEKHQGWFSLYCGREAEWEREHFAHGGKMYLEAPS